MVYDIYKLKKGKEVQIDTTNNLNDAKSLAIYYSKDNKHNYLIKEKKDIGVYYGGEKIKQ